MKLKTYDELFKYGDEYAERMSEYYKSTHQEYLPSQFREYVRDAWRSGYRQGQKDLVDEQNRICPKHQNYRNP